MKISRIVAMVLLLSLVAAWLPGEALAVDTTPMYRLYNPNSGEHFYTGSVEERDNLVAVGWNYEGIAWHAPISGGAPVHRVFNPNSGDHHYTMSQDEVDMLVALGWQYEGVCWNSPSQGSAQYRLWNPNADLGSHHYTNSLEERDTLVSLGWVLEGIGWYGVVEPIHTHNYTATVTAPTCTERGYTTYTCSCGNTYTDQYTDATGHDNKLVSDTATCTEPGIQTSQCVVCGAITEAESAAKGHGSTTAQTVEPTCIEDGYTVTICNDCGANVSKTILESTGEHSYTKTMRMSDAAKSMLDKGYGGLNGTYINFTEWDVDVCPSCGDYNADTMRFIYSDYQAALEMLNYINDLRESVYGTDEYNLKLDNDLLGLSQTMVKEISVNYRYDGSRTNYANANMLDGGWGVKSHFDRWSDGGGTYAHMIDKDAVYFGYALYRRPEAGSTAGCFGIALFWTEEDRDGYIYGWAN